MKANSFKTLSVHGMNNADLTSLEKDELLRMYDFYELCDAEGAKISAKIKSEIKKIINFKLYSEYLNLTKEDIIEETTKVVSKKNKKVTTNKVSRRKKNIKKRGLRIKSRNLKKTKSLKRNKNIIRRRKAIMISKIKSHKRFIKSRTLINKHGKEFVLLGAIADIAPISDYKIFTEDIPLSGIINKGQIVGRNGLCEKIRRVGYTPLPTPKGWLFNHGYINMLAVKSTHVKIKAGDTSRQWARLNQLMYHVNEKSYVMANDVRYAIVDMDDNDKLQSILPNDGSGYILEGTLNIHRSLNVTGSHVKVMGIDNANKLAHVDTPTFKGVIQVLNQRRFNKLRKYYNLSEDCKAIFPSDSIKLQNGNKGGLMDIQFIQKVHEESGEYGVSISTQYLNRANFTSKGLEYISDKYRAEFNSIFSAYEGYNSDELGRKMALITEDNDIGIATYKANTRLIAGGYALSDAQVVEASLKTLLNKINSLKVRGATATIYPNAGLNFFEIKVSKKMLKDMKKNIGDYVTGIRSPITETEIQELKIVGLCEEGIEINPFFANLYFAADFDGDIMGLIAESGIIIPRKLTKQSKNRASGKLDLDNALYRTIFSQSMIPRIDNVLSIVYENMHIFDNAAIKIVQSVLQATIDGIKHAGVNIVSDKELRERLNFENLLANKGKISPFLRILKNSLGDYSNGYGVMYNSIVIEASNMARKNEYVLPVYKAIWKGVEGNKRFITPLLAYSDELLISEERANKAGVAKVVKSVRDMYKRLKLDITHVYTTKRSAIGGVENAFMIEQGLRNNTDITPKMIERFNEVSKKIYSFNGRRMSGKALIALAIWRYNMFTSNLAKGELDVAFSYLKMYQDFFNEIDSASAVDIAKALVVGVVLPKMKYTKYDHEKKFCGEVFFPTSPKLIGYIPEIDLSNGKTFDIARLGRQTLGLENPIDINVIYSAI